LETREAYIGVDVGTLSVRAGVFDAAGGLIASAKRPIKIWSEPGEVVEHSSSDIWTAACQAVREAVFKAELSAEAYRGLGFDATCSLVALDRLGSPVSVSPTDANERDTIVWMDHRAQRETDEINAGGHPILRYLGGRISPEMQTPKLLWLARHKPETMAKARHFLDLTDFLSFRASGSLSRSVCTVTCKFTYLAHEGRWDSTYFDAIGLGGLAQGGFERLGADVVEPGTPLGRGLKSEAAEAMGLAEGIPVAAGLIDAHAGAVGTIGASLNGEPADPRRRIALILGTSSCCMTVSDEPRFLPGVWGPYFSALLPRQWLLEAGQSAFGAAIDRLMRLHPAFADLAREAGEGALERVERDVVERAKGLSQAALLARDLHVLPDFLGNRSPLADSCARGAIVGLDLREDRASLGELYVAGLTGLAHGVAEIVDVLERDGATFEMIVVSGGAARSPLVRQIIADATGKIVGAPRTSEPVLLGAAMLGAVAAGRHTMASAMPAMSAVADLARPWRGEIADFHARKRQAFLRLQQVERGMREAMR